MIRQYINPQKNEWEGLARRSALQAAQLSDSVEKIFQAVKAQGDGALKNYSQQFDGVTIQQFKVSTETINTAQVAPELYEAMQLAANNIKKFHKSQSLTKNVIQTSPGVNCWQREVAIQKVGLYIPGGSAPLLSTVLMLAIPAKLAGCQEIVLCTPPQKDGSVAAAILVACKIAGVDTIYTVGGAQAIAAMCFGTESIPKVYKILGPGNQYVTRAKEMATNYGVAIDMPAGPSELLVIADKSCNPAYVAADLLSQAEHGSDSQVVVLSDNQQVLDNIAQAVSIQLENLSRREIAKAALKNSFAILFDSIAACMDWSNFYAPEHLIIATKDASNLANEVQNAGSVFIGNYSPESAGDYASGTNHTLPTSGFAKNHSGVSLSSFTKKITYQEISATGLKNIGPAIELMAAAEGLDAHQNAVSIRLKDLANV